MRKVEFLDLLRYRKSTRSFTNEPITEEELDKIITAAADSPVGSALYRDLHLTIVQNPQVLKRLSEAANIRRKNKEETARIVAQSGKLDTVLEAKDYDPYYGATTVIFVAHRKQTLQPGIEFSNVACVVYSMQMEATSLGLGSVFMWYVLESMRVLPEYDHTNLLNLPEDFEPLMGIAIGHIATPTHPRTINIDRIKKNYI